MDRSNDTADEPVPGSSLNTRASDPDRHAQGEAGRHYRAGHEPSSPVGQSSSPASSDQ